MTKKKNKIFLPDFEKKKSISNIFFYLNIWIKLVPGLNRNEWQKYNLFIESFVFWENSIWKFIKYSEKHNWTYNDKKLSIL